MIRPVEMQETLPMELPGGVVSTTSDVWAMLCASRDGDLDLVAELAARCPALIRCEYNYTPPLHFAVREGHLELARYLLDRGADPTYRTYCFEDPLPTMARDREHGEVARLIEERLSRPAAPAPSTEGKAIHGVGHIDYGRDEERVRFQRLVGRNALADVEELLAKRPELARDEIAFWGEGILSMPANRGDRAMLELLIRHGARVPDCSKWGRAYYFKHHDIAAFLLENGMGPDHVNWHRITLLHDMAQAGDVAKARLLLDHGASLDPVDEEYRSTPLGLAARWGRREMVAFLLERGADPGKAGVRWATPLAWARKKGHAEVEADLRKAGA